MNRKQQLKNDIAEYKYRIRSAAKMIGQYAEQDDLQSIAILADNITEYDTNLTETIVELTTLEMKEERRHGYRERTEAEFFRSEADDYRNG